MPARVGQPLDQHQADALAPAGTVGGRGERLAPAVGGQAALPGEPGEGVGGGHHGDPAGQRQVAFAGAQRLRGQVQRDKRRRAGGVDGDGRAFQTEAVGDPPGGDAARVAGAEEALDLLRHHGEPAQVVVVHQADEHPGPGAAQAERVDAGVLEGLPRGFEQQPLLRVHRHAFARADAEQAGVEIGGLVEESALAGVRGAGVVGVGVVEALDVPAAVGGERADAVAARGDQVPELVRGGDPAGVAAGHADDDDRVVGGPQPWRRPGPTARRRHRTVRR